MRLTAVSPTCSLWSGFYSRHNFRMRYRVLGRTGLDVSEIGFGCWAIGGTSYGPTKDEESLQALEAAWENGVNFFDTADTYGHGHSESLLAQFLKGKPREKIIVATKAGWDFYDGRGSRKNFDPAYLRMACEKSLQRLRIDTIDLYQLHNPSLELIQKGEVISVLEALKKEGKIRFIGISLHTEEEALAAMKDQRVDTLQLVFNLLDQRMGRRIFSQAGKEKVGLIVREPLACGLLTGKYAADYEFPKTDHRRRYQREKMSHEIQKVEMIHRILSTQRLTLTCAALEYILAYEEISTVIPGAKTPVQVLDNIQATKNPRLRSQEIFLLREMAAREEAFNKHL